MMGAYIAWTADLLDRFLRAGRAAHLPAALLLGVVVETWVRRRLYARDHLDQVLATFGPDPVLQRAGARGLGPAGKSVAVPPSSAAPSRSSRAVPYPAYRFAIIVVGVRWRCCSPGWSRAPLAC